MIFDTHRDTCILQIAHQRVNLTTQHGIQGRPHIQLAYSTTSTANRSGTEIGFHHHDIKRLLATFFRPHSCKFILYGRVFGGRHIKCKRKIIQPVLDYNGNIEINRTCSTILSFGYGSADTVGRLKVQHRVHRIACPFYVTAVIYGKLFGCNHRQSIFHQTTAQGITSCQGQVTLRSIFHGKVTSPFQFDTIVIARIQIYFQTDGRINMNHHNHVQTA